MNKKLIALTSLATLLILPVAVFAFNAGTPPAVNSGSLNVNDLLDIVFSFIWPIVVAIVIISFILSAFLFITAQGDPGKVTQGRQAIIWGVVGIVVLLISYSIVFIVRNQFPNL